MRKTILICMMLLTLTIASCSGKRAEELFETAQLEELQNNREHARQLYQEILSKYPDSKFALKAEARLLELQEKNKP
jgi:TolA-binding protein